MNPDLRPHSGFHQTTSFRPLLLCGLLLASVAAAQAQTQSFTTWAGYAGQLNADGTGTNALFYEPAGVAMDSASNLYVADFSNNTIRKITPAGVVTTLAGSPGKAGSANGFGTNASFNGPEGIAVDGSGNIYVADSGNDTIRMITPSGQVSTLAGSAGMAGSLDKTGTNALFNAPAAVAVDTLSNVYVADYGNDTIRKITPSGAVSTLAGSAGNFGSSNDFGGNAQFYQPSGVAVDALGNVYVADTGNDMIREITAGGAVSTLAGSAGNFGSSNGIGANASFNAPVGISVDAGGNVYVADTGNNLIRKITSLGAVTTVAGMTNSGSRDGSGTNALFWGPMAVAVDGSGNLFVADYFNGTIREISSSGTVSTLAGSASNGSEDGPGATARFSINQSVALDSGGNLYVADAANNTIRKITTSGIVSTLAGSAGNPGSVNGAGTNAQFYAPQAVAVDNSGNVYVADTLNDTIRKITPAGSVSTLAGLAGYANNADGTGTNAQFYNPQGIAVDGSGNIYVADTLNDTIRKITPGGAVTTIAGTAGTYGSADSTNGNAFFNQPKGLVLDSANNLYVADCFNHTIRQITPSGTVTTLAGLAGVWGSADGTNSNARFFEPEAVAVDPSGNVYVADSGNHTIRKLTPVGTNWVVTTVGGMAGVSGSADGATNNALFDYPGGIAADGYGNVYVADSGNNTIRLGRVPQLSTIGNVAVTPRPTSAIITWTTTVPATSQVAYGTTTNYGSFSAFNASLVTNHAVMLTGLQTNQTYNFEAISQYDVDQATAVGSFSTDLSIILESQQAIYQGGWILDSSGADRYSPVYKYASVAPAAAAAQATFTPTIVTPGQYDVYIWYSEGLNRSQVAPVTATFSGGAVSTTVNERINGGRWQLVAGNEPFAAGTNAFVALGNYTGEANKIVIADAVKWSYTPGQDIPVNGNVPAWWATFYYGTSGINASLPAANGYSILKDYILGIAPNDPNTRLNFNLAPSGSGFQAVFSPFVGGRIYQLQGTTNLADPSAWQTLANLPVTQDANGNGVIAYTNSTAAPEFYRLSVQLAP